MAYSLILVALSSTVCTLVAQSNPGRCTYSGVVLDATSQEPLIGVSLWVEELHQGVATDADGAFSLSLPTNGEYHIKVSYVGYKDYTFRYKRVSQAPQRILLSSAAAELGTVFVHGKGQAQRLREIPSSITVIDTRELHGTVSSLNEVLNRSMGVKVTSTGGIGSTSRMIIQGLDGKRIALFVNGIPMGYIFHTLCELMPLFAGLSVATEEMTTEKLPAMTTFTGWALYLVPLVGLLCSCYGKQRWNTIVSFVLACLTLLLNICHLCTDLLPHFTWAQAAILPFVCVVAVLLVIDLWKELRTSKAQ